MKKQIALMFCLVFLIGSVLATDVNKVGDWWGTVKVNGEYINGAVVDTYINNVKVASAIVGTIQPNYYLIHVEGSEGDTVIFKVNGKEATTQSWSNGDHELDLEVDNVNDNSYIAPSSGGSGGGSSSSSVPSSIVQTINEDGIVNLNLEIKEGEKDIVEINSSEIQETIGPGITGAVIGFAKTGKGIGLIIAFLIIVLGIGVITIKFQPLKKWTEKSSG